MSEIYLNTAGAGKMPHTAIQTIKDYLDYETKLGGYTAADNSTERIADFYTQASTLINAKSSDKIAFTDCASRSWNIALQSAPLKDDATIITLSSEFGTNLISIYNYARKIRAKVELIECETDGSFSLADLESKIPDSNTLIALSHAAAQGSIINPVGEISKIARKTGAIYLVDGCQAVGNIPVNVQEINCDAYTATGRKWLCGPRGTGFLYIGYTKFCTDHLDLGAAELTFDTSGSVNGVKLSPDARHFEMWERSIANMLGFTEAIREQLKLTPTSISKKISNLSDGIRKVITKNSKLQILGKKESSSGISGFYVKDKTQEISAIQRFSTANINLAVMSSSNCPAFIRKELDNKLIFRISPAYNTSPAAIEKVKEVIAEL